MWILYYPCKSFIYWTTSKLPSFRSEQKDLKDGTSKSQTVGSLLSAYDDDSHDETEDTVITVAKVETVEMKTVPTVESRSWSNWEDMWLSFWFKKINVNFWGGFFLLFCLRLFFWSECFSSKMTDLLYLNVFWSLYVAGLSMTLFVWWEGSKIAVMQHAETDCISMHFKIWTNDILLPEYSFMCILTFDLLLSYNNWPSLTLEITMPCLLVCLQCIQVGSTAASRHRHGEATGRSRPRMATRLVALSSWISTGTATWMLYTTLSLHGWYKEATVWWFAVVQWCSMCFFWKSWNVGKS